MTPKTKSVILTLGFAVMVLAVLGLTVLVAGCASQSNIPKGANHGMANAKMESTLDSKPESPVHSIVMPHDEPEFPPGRGRDEFVTACVVCHSPRYITMQPRFSRTVWLSEVNKMKDSYGAHISDEQVPVITDYLVSINGKPDSGKGPKGVSYGE
jgi:mono/diheme cytochrome c family protein